jgi:hypothetical protein
VTKRPLRCNVPGGLVRWERMFAPDGKSGKEDVLRTSRFHEKLFIGMSEVHRTADATQSGGANSGRVPAGLGFRARARSRKGVSALRASLPHVALPPLSHLLGAQFGGKPLPLNVEDALYLLNVAFVRGCTRLTNWRVNPPRSSQ